MALVSYRCVETVAYYSIFVREGDIVASCEWLEPSSDSVGILPTAAVWFTGYVLYEKNKKLQQKLDPERGRRDSRDSESIRSPHRRPRLCCCSVQVCHTPFFHSLV